MVGELMACIMQNYSKEDPLTEHLHKENQQIKMQLQLIERDIQEIPVHQIIACLGKKQQKSALKLDRVDYRLNLLEEYYAACKASQQIHQKCQFLLQQIHLICSSAQQMALIDNIGLFKEPYSPQHSQVLKQIGNRLDEQIVSWQNRQNINKFNCQDNQICQQYQNCIIFLNKYQQAIFSIFDQMVKSIYKIDQKEATIYLEHYTHLWTEPKQYHQGFIQAIVLFLDKFVVYDVSQRQYTIFVYQLQRSDKVISLKKVSNLIFDHSEANVHYQTITESLKKVRHFFSTLLDETPQKQKQLINCCQKKVLQKIKDYFQYLIPYLKMQKRRQFLNFLTSNLQNSTTSIYDLLVNLKVSGQDADSLISTIKQIVQKINEDADNLAAIMKFIELAQYNKKNYNLILFISDQLMEQFEEMAEITPIHIHAIKELLTIREEMRVKIHNVDSM